MSKVASHRLLCCVPTLYVYMSKCYFINVKNKHEERLTFDRLFVRVFLRLLNFPTSSKSLLHQYPPLWWMMTVTFTSSFR